MDELRVKLDEACALAAELTDDAAGLLRDELEAAIGRCEEIDEEDDSDVE